MKTLPAQYAKFITAIVTAGLSYLQVYGPVWHTGPAVGGIIVCLGVLGVPNADKPVKPSG